jgi:RHS repeat-associated protein
MANEKHQENNRLSSQKTAIDSLTPERATKSNGITIPEISLPKGGGALKGIDEKFKVNAANGTAAFSIPVPLTPGRNGFNPALSVEYNSGAGNSLIGLGWSLEFQSIHCKTDKRLPRYREPDTEEDTFMISGSEDLVPVTKTEQFPGNEYSIRVYRPRIEGAFARIEKIIHPVHGTYWKVTTQENIVTFFGKNINARIADPNDRSHIFQWLPEFSYDNKGNWIQYRYKQDTNIKKDGTLQPDDSIPNTLHEKNRKSGLAPFTNSYLKSVRYGNHKAWYADVSKPHEPITPTEAACFFELLIDYGEHNDPKEPHKETVGWTCRPDAFSSYRAGFEIRTQRICKRILMLHHFSDERQFIGTPEETGFGINYLVRSLDFIFEPSAINSSHFASEKPKQTEFLYLRSITQNGYIRKPDGNYSQKSLPPIEFIYETLNWNKSIKTVTRENIEHAPSGLKNNYQWVDLYGEGVSGILKEEGAGWYYKSNLGDIDGDGMVHFTKAKEVIPRPSLMGLSANVLSVQDLEASGEKQIVVRSPGVNGYFELTEDDSWTAFQPFDNFVNIDPRDPYTRMIDLNGDGQAELVITQENVFVWYAADGKRGHLPAEFAVKPFDEEMGPAIVFADSMQSVFLADMTGDGLTDIVRICNGDICYWANMGYGRFSSKISMANAPRFDYTGQYNPEFIHLADITGTGATDIIYSGCDGLKAYLNLSGNAWSDVHEIEPFFPTDNHSQLSVIDLLGTGTSCIVWSSDLPGEANAPMRYIDLMNGKKPHLLKKIINNCGKETSIEYKSSAFYYLKDKLEGRQWITKLPFPVQVIAKTITEDKISEVRFTTEYRYHHGYYDSAEREFRGFGMVEQLDTENYPSWKKNNDGNRLEKSEDLYQAPVLTKTWIHTGAFLEREKIFSHFEKEYWYEVYKKTFPDETLLTQEPKIPDARTMNGEKMNIEEWREALRACKGVTIRQEVFSLDGKENDDESLRRQAKPYSVTARSCHIQMLQPKGENRFAVFMPNESEVITISYERNEADPRIAHKLNIRLDELGNTLESVSVVYPRKNTAAIQALITSAAGLVYEREPEKNAYLNSLQKLQIEQTKSYILFTKNSFTTDIKETDCYRLRLPAETKTYEITGLPDPDPIYRPAIFEGILNHPKGNIEFHSSPVDGENMPPFYRLIEHIQSTYYDDILKNELPLSIHGRHGIAYQSYQLAYTPALLKTIFDDKLPADPAALEKLLSDNDHDANKKYSQCRFIHRNDANWWIRSGTSDYYLNAAENFSNIQSRFFTPQSFRNPFGAQTKVFYYKDYFLATQAIEDVLGNSTAAERFNFRTIAPMRIKDINDNIAEIVMDELGMVKATASMGKGNEADSLKGFTEYTLLPERDAIKNYFSISETNALRFAAQNLLMGASTRFVYDFDAYLIAVHLGEQQPIVTNDCSRIKYRPITSASITREQYFMTNPTSPLVLGFEYSDGLGKLVMTKTQAEPGEALQLTVNADCSFLLQTINTGNQLRWIGNGRTICNNKGNPVKQYEPYFSVNPFYEDNKELVERGVTPVIYYDAAGRNIQTKLPDGSFSKIAFDSWQQISYDTNDTVADSDWYKDRINHRIDNLLLSTAKDPDKEKQAAEKSFAHFNTPSVMHLDAMGRPVAAIDHNKTQNGNNEYYSTFVSLDCEGNVKEVTDARGNAVVKYKYDMLGHRVYENSMDAGEKWMLNDISGKPVRAWDSRNQVFLTIYDELQRPVENWLEKAGDSFLYEKMIYGTDKTKNLRGQISEKFDTGGLIIAIRFDFRGKLLESQRHLAAAFESAIIDWSEGSSTNRLDTEVFSSNTEFDALGRMTRLYNFHRNNNNVTVYEPSYNERGLLKSEDIITGAQIVAGGFSGGSRVTAISAIEYSEKSRPISICYGNNTVTRYHYDLQTFRLVQLRTTRNANAPLPVSPSNLSDANVLQNLYYTYDAAGNITVIEDDAYEPVFFKNQQVQPRSRYTYDALYRLIAAEGRENQNFDNAPLYKEPVPVKVSFPVTDATLRNYEQHYRYDAAGNILQMRHISTAERWTRQYTYAANNNRLVKTWQGNDITNAVKYQYDDSGNMLNYSNTPDEFHLQWDFRNMIQQVSLGGGGNVFYQYGSDKQRSRKFIRRDANKTEERLYIDGAEIYRRRNGNSIEEEIETHHLFAGSQRVLIVENVLQTNNPELPAGIVHRYQYSNHLDSSGLEMDKNAAIISYEEYHPYGTLAYRAVNTGIKTVAKRYRYTGMERDEETGMNYHSARYYLPWLGRWASCDPVSSRNGGHDTIYGNNTPIVQYDIDGRQALYPKNYSGPPIPELDAKIAQEREAVEARMQRDETSLETWVRHHPDAETALGFVFFVGNILMLKQDLTNLKNSVRPPTVSSGRVSTPPKVSTPVTPSVASKPVVSAPVTPVAPVSRPPEVHMPDPSELAAAESATASRLATTTPAAPALPAAPPNVSTSPASVPNASLPQPNMSSAPAPHIPASYPNNPRNLPIDPKTGKRLFDVWLGGLKRETVRPGETYDGIHQRMRVRMQKWAEKYGTIDGPPTTRKNVVVGHVEGQAHVLTPAGKSAQVAPQTVAGNQSFIQSEIEEAALRRQWNAEHPDAPQLPVRPVGQKRN